MENFEKRVIDVLIFENKLPETGIFEITENHIKSYIELYGNMFGKDKSRKLKNDEYRFARKLAGRTLIKLNIERGAKFNNIKAGMVYMIENPAFPYHYKIGMTLDVVKRLSQYQVYDPFKRFKVVKYNFVMDRSSIEKTILNHPCILKEDGEWIAKKNAIELFSKITNPR